MKGIIYEVTWYPKVYGDCEKSYSYIIAKNRNDAWNIVGKRFKNVDVVEVAPCDRWFADKIIDMTKYVEYRNNHEHFIADIKKLRGVTIRRNNKKHSFKITRDSDCGGGVKFVGEGYFLENGHISFFDYNWFNEIPHKEYFE